MLVAVYKSSKKADTYLYIPKRDDFSTVPDALMKTFGTPLFVMLIPLEKKQSLASVDIEKLKAQLRDPGFYLQVPPPPEDLLKAHRKQLGKDE